MGRTPPTDAGQNPVAEPPFCDSDAEHSDEPHWIEKRPRSQQILQCVLLNLCGIMWQADNNILPAAYLEISREFHVGPARLGTLTFIRGVTEACFAFPAGFAADVKPRPVLMFVGILTWAAGMAGCGLATSFTGLILARMLNGAGLGIVQPILYSLISDTNPPDRRGIAFGTVQFTGNVGQMGGNYFATTLAPLTVLGILGWRFVFLAFAAVSAAVGVAMVLGVREPRGRDPVRPKVSEVLRQNAPAVCRILRIPTFLVIIGQGIAGTAPWFAFSYLTIWLELGCFDHRQAATINASFVAGQAVAGLLGGKLLDVLSSRLPDHGPAFLCQFSVGIGLPLFGFIFFGLQNNADGGMTGAFAATFGLAGALIAWCAIANNKIFADIVPQAVFTYVYALDRTLEGAFGALGTPAVGQVTERYFHYNQTAAATGECSPPDASSLGSGIFSVCLVTWGVCFLFYGILHCTYPADRRARDMVLKPQPFPCAAEELGSDSNSEENADERDSDEATD